MDRKIHLNKYQIYGDDSKWELLESGTSSQIMSITSSININRSVNILGTLNLSDELSDNTIKRTYLNLNHYYNSEEDVSLIQAESIQTAHNLSIGGGSTLYNSVNNILFFTSDNTTTIYGTERMRIAYNGNVGIGSASPVHKLSVSNGDISLDHGRFLRFGGQLAITKENYGEMKFYAGAHPTTGGFNFNTWNGSSHDSNALVFRNDKKLGIDTLTPQFRIDIGADTIDERTIGFNGDPVLYYPDQNGTAHINSLALGSGLRKQFNGGGNEGSRNTAIGVGSQLEVTTGSGNTSLGANSLELNVSGTANTALGFLTGQYVLGGSNTLVGFGAMRYGSTINNTVALGYYAGYQTATSSNVTDNVKSTYLGTLTKPFRPTGISNEIIIGYNAEGLGSNTVVIGNDDIIKTALKGKVGIGTTAPTTELQVVGEFSLLDSSGTQSVRLTPYSSQSNYIAGGGVLGVGTRFPNTNFGLDVVNDINTDTQYRIDDVVHSSRYGLFSTYLGPYSGHGNTQSNVTGLGAYSLSFNSGNNAVAVGSNAGQFNTGDYTAAIGDNTMRYNTGEESVGVGSSVLTNNTGRRVVGIGHQSGNNNTGIMSNFIGAFVGGNNTGNYVNGMGFGVLSSNTAAYAIAIGFNTMRFNTGDYSIGIGSFNLDNNNGQYNIAIGHQAAYETYTLDGSYNTFLGSRSTYATSSITNSTAVGSNVTLTDSNTVILGNDASVGVGTTSPTEKLDVVGRIRSDEIKVDSTNRYLGFVDDTLSLLDKSVIVVDSTTDNNSDGLADYFTIVNTGTASLVTGNGHIGTAQRLEYTSGTLAGLRFETSSSVIGKNLTISFMYRHNAASNISFSNGFSNSGFPEITANTGSASRYEKTDVWEPTGGPDSVFIFSWLRNPGEYIEVSDITITPVDGLATDESVNVEVGRLGLGSDYSRVDIGGFDKTETGYTTAIWSNDTDALRIYDSSNTQIYSVSDTGNLDISGTYKIQNETILRYNHTQDSLYIGVGAGYESNGDTLNSVNVGYESGKFNTGDNTNGFGYFSLQNNISEYSNGFGSYALMNNDGLASNGFGYAALRDNTGDYSNGFGMSSLRNNTGRYSSGFGHYSLETNTGIQSNGFGYFSLQKNTGDNSNGFGKESLRFNTGIQSNGFGHNSLENNAGDNSNGFGANTLTNNIGDNNSAIGHNSGYETFSLTGRDNTFLGAYSTYATSSITNSTAVGSGITLTDSDTVILGNVANVGIGTTSPTEKLEVIGNIQATGYITGIKCGAAGYLATSRDITVATASTYYPIGGFTVPVAENFSVGVSYPDGLKYDGTKTQYFTVDFHGTLEASTNTTTAQISVQKNGTNVAMSIMGVFCKNSGEMYNVSGTCVLELAQNDEVQFAVTSDGNGDIITFDYFTAKIKEFFD